MPFLTPSGCTSASTPLAQGNPLQRSYQQHLVLQGLEGPGEDNDQLGVSRPVKKASLLLLRAELGETGQCLTEP